MESHEEWEKKRLAWIAARDADMERVDFRVISGIARSGLSPVSAAGAIKGYLDHCRHLPRSENQITPIQKPKHPDFRVKIADFLAGVALGMGLACFLAAWLVIQ